MKNGEEGVIWERGKRKNRELDRKKWRGRGGDRCLERGDGGIQQRQKQRDL